MITLEEPHMALNSEELRTVYKMWQNCSVPKMEPREKIIKHTANVARTASDGKLKNLVINCHGGPGHIRLGEGFGLSDVKLFADWAGLIEKIWISACATGHGTKGSTFCSELAKQVKCYVVAPENLQRSRERTYPYGKLDTYEGLVVSYDPDGEVRSFKKYTTWWRGGNVALSLTSSPMAFA